MKTHRTDGVSLSFGTVFLFIVVWWVLAQFVTLALPAVGWMVAIALIVFGVFGLIGAFRSGRGAVPAPTSGAPIAAGGVPAGLHADIVRELMENQRTSGGTESSARAGTPVGIDQTRLEEPPAPTAAFTPIRSAEPASPYATDYLTVSDPDPADAADHPHPADDAEHPAPADPTRHLDQADATENLTPADATGHLDQADATKNLTPADGDDRRPDPDRTEVIDGTQTKEIRTEGDGERR
ncbi:hypothetical protein ACIA8K_27005 [Catenuloplanes sp. NPDC051500]|uniref:hypothetical protein n=1 Tax=Catenuloplanes sp. NPDC051500 TaxID=3363959 RepID=UPI0037B2574F